MTKEEILEFVTKNPVFSLATTDGNQPHVRLIMLYRADEDGIIFCTGRDKAVHEQLQANPAVEMCFYNADDGRQVRIEGTVEMLDDLELKMQVTVHGYFEGIEQRTQSQNARFQLDEL